MIDETDLTQLVARFRQQSESPGRGEYAAGSADAWWQAADDLEKLIEERSA